MNFSDSAGLLGKQAPGKNENFHKGDKVQAYLKFTLMSAVGDEGS